MGSWKYIGISSVDFKKSHIYEMVAEFGFFFIHVDGFLCAGRRGEEGKRREKREREKKGGKRKNTFKFKP